METGVKQADGGTQSQCDGGNGFGEKMAERSMQSCGIAEAGAVSLLSVPLQ